MIVRASRSKTLLVGPIGARPWIAPHELAAQLEAIGHEVVVNEGHENLVIPYPDPLPPRVGALANLLPRVVWWLVRMLWRWRSRARRALAAGGYTHVLVWDPILAALYRFARPPGIELVWVLPPPEGYRLYQRVMRVVCVLLADRVVVSKVGESRFARSRETVVPLSTAVDPAPLLDTWVVLGSDRAPSSQSLAALKARAVSQPATALLFDSRDHDRMTPDSIELVRQACGAPHVWWVGDDEWIGWLGGVPREAIDPSEGLAPDHRHQRLLSLGGKLLAPASTPIGMWAQLLERHADDGRGWAAFMFREGIGEGVDDAAWAAAAFPAPRPTRADLIHAHAVPVRSCPMCPGIGRRIIGETDSGTFIVRCPRCRLHRASHVLPAEVLHTVEYHTGEGVLGADYLSDGGRVGVEQVADHRLDVLGELGITGGRLLDVGAGLGHLVARAAARGWDAEGLEVVAGAADLAKTLYDVVVHVGDIASAPELGRFDVVVLGQTLEHFADPVGALHTIRERLVEPGGHVLVEVPNVKSLARLLQRSAWMHWQPGDHHTYPDDWTLRQMLYKGGFDTRLLRSDSLAIEGLPELVTAFNLGLLSGRLATQWPQLQRVLKRANADPMLRAATRIVDGMGYGQNLIAVGQARCEEARCE